MITTEYALVVNDTNTGESIIVSQTPAPLALPALGSRFRVQADGRVIGGKVIGGDTQLVEQTPGPNGVRVVVHQVHVDPHARAAPDEGAEPALPLAFLRSRIGAAAPYQQVWTEELNAVRPRGRSAWLTAHGVMRWQTGGPAPSITVAPGGPWANWPGGYVSAGGQVLPGHSLLLEVEAVHQQGQLNVSFHAEDGTSFGDLQVASDGHGRWLALSHPVAFPAGPGFASFGLTGSELEIRRIALHCLILP